MSGEVYKVHAPEPQTLTVGSGAAARRIAFSSTAAATPGLFWLSGFMSDMASTKATALSEWARQKGLSFAAFDYSGHGRSGGDFKDGTIGRWLEEAAAVFSAATTGPQIVIGSSMGGHISLNLLRGLRETAPAEAQRIHALVLIAPAWDMTEELMWNKFSAEVRQEIMDKGYHLRPSAYDAPYTITRNLIVEGRAHLLAGKPFDAGCPVTILQGLQDPDVPAAHTRALTAFLKAEPLRLIEIADGEHRLSRPQDLDKLYQALDELI